MIIKLQCAIPLLTASSKCVAEEEVTLFGTICNKESRLINTTEIENCTKIRRSIKMKIEDLTIKIRTCSVSSRLRIEDQSKCRIIIRISLSHASIRDQNTHTTVRESLKIVSSTTMQRVALIISRLTSDPWTWFQPAERCLKECRTAILL